MGIRERVEQIAKSVVLIDERDLHGLVQLQELFEALRSEIDEAELAALTSALERAEDLVGGIVMRQVEDAVAAFETVRETVQYAQATVEAIDRGDDPPAFQGRPTDADAPAEPVDELDAELLQAWVSSCEHALAALESNVVEVESAEDPEELLAEIRRSIHTFKGECGVLALHLAQKLCHEAESAVDACIQADKAFPVDDVLRLIDWLKEYTVLLADDPRAQAPDSGDLLERFQSFQSASVEAGKETVANEMSEPRATADAESDECADATPVEASESAAPESEAPADGDLVVFPTDLAMDENIDDFLCEAREHIAAAEEALLALEDDFEDSELINTVFRAFHTIKGVAGFMHLTPIVELAHCAEHHLDQARTKALTLNSAHLDLTLSSCDMMSQLVGMLGGSPAPPRAALDALIGRIKSAAAGELSDAPAPVADESAVGAGAAEGAGSPAAVASSPESEPNAMAPSGTQTTPVVATTAPKPPAGKSAQKPAEVKKDGAARKRADHTVKVNTGRMDNLVDMVGELVIAQQMVAQDDVIRDISDQRLQRNLGHTQKIIRDLQEVAMSLRMVTVKATFQKMARIVRDVATKAHKNIRFCMEGEDVELDRNVVEEIADPLVHMVRNSCDHGIESAADRTKAGKPEQGQLTLRAYHQGGAIVIEVEDDGHGLDRDKILAKAVERGVIGDRDPSDLSDQEVYNMVFQAGFSTADKVTDISGRGVGMDVVRRNIEALRGKVEITSTPGQGSIFSMRLPLTMAIIDGMVVRVGNERYVLPTLSIEQSFQPTAEQLHSVIGDGETVTVRGSLLPIYRLNRVLELENGIEDITDALLIVVESNNSRCCMVVDEILGQQQVVIKSLGEGIDKTRGVSGGAILGDGRVALILDVSGIVNEATEMAV